MTTLKEFLEIDAKSSEFFYYHKKIGNRCCLIHPDKSPNKEHHFAIDIHDKVIKRKIMMVDIQELGEISFEIGECYYSKKFYVLPDTDSKLLDVAQKVCDIFNSHPPSENFSDDFVHIKLNTNCDGALQFDNGKLKKE